MENKRAVVDRFACWLLFYDFDKKEQSHVDRRRDREIRLCIYKQDSKTKNTLEQEIQSEDQNNKTIGWMEARAKCCESLFTQQTRESK